MRRRSKIRSQGPSTLFAITAVISVALSWAAFPAAAREGRVVANFDDWTLTGTGFGEGHDADAYLVNIADWFTRGATGSFLGLGNSFHLGNTAFAAALAGAGHAYVRSEQPTFTLEELQAYDGVFIGARPLGEDPGNLVALEQYVAGGGGVYIFGGTNFYGSIAADSAVLNAFLDGFGLAFATEMTIYAGTYGVSGGHGILAGVQELYCDNGTILTDLDPGSLQNEIVEPTFGGTVAVFDGEAAVSVPETAAPSAALRAWPNPAEGAVRLSLSPGTVGPVPVRIYSVSGRLVRELFAVAESPASRVEVIWDGRSEAGERVAGGVYVARPAVAGARGVPLTVVR